MARSPDRAISFLTLTMTVAGTQNLVRLDRFHVLATDLKVKTIRILDVKAVVGIGLWTKAATLQFRLYRILVPILDGISNVIDPRRRHSQRGIARNHKRIRIAENQIALLTGIRDGLHS